MKVSESWYTIPVRFLNGERKYIGAFKSMGTYKERCLNYRAIKHKDSSYITLEEKYTYKAHNVVINF